MILLELVYTAQFFWQRFLSESSYLKASTLWKHEDNMALCYFILNLPHGKSKLVLVSLSELVQRNLVEKCVVSPH